MDQPDNDKNKSRRQFLSIFTSAKKKSTTTEMVSMLTADGKLVTIPREVLQKAATNNKASKKEIYEWMNNPSKENN